MPNKKPCPHGTVKNPESNRCVLTTGRTGQAILKNNTPILTLPDDAGMTIMAKTNDLSLRSLLATSKDLQRLAHMEIQHRLTRLSKRLEKALIDLRDMGPAFATFRAHTTNPKVFDVYVWATDYLRPKGFRVLRYMNYAVDVPTLDQVDTSWVFGSSSGHMPRWDVTMDITITIGDFVFEFYIYFAKSNKIRLSCMYWEVRGPHVTVGFYDLNPRATLNHTFHLIPRARTNVYYVNDDTPKHNALELRQIAALVDSVRRPREPTFPLDDLVHVGDF